MLTKIYLLMYGVGVGENLLIAFLVIFSIICVIVLILLCYEEEFKTITENFNRYKKKLVTLFIIEFLLIFAMSAYPSKKEVITFIVLTQADSAITKVGNSYDQYLDKNPDSKLQNNGDAIFKLIDKTISKVDAYLGNDKEKGKEK